MAGCAATPGRVGGRLPDELIRNIQQLAELVAQRVGRDPDDLAVRTFAGALIGVVMAVMPAMVQDPSVDFLALIDAAMAQLEAGLPL